MTVYQFEDKNLSHYSYAILSEQQIVVLDPGRDPQPYLEFALTNEATIIYILETHPHADFISGKIELAELTGATIVCSALTPAGYPHLKLHDGGFIAAGKVLIEVIGTPGHSPDSVCYLLYNEAGLPASLFTGDTLLIGDVGRPDLRENAAGQNFKSEDLASMLYDSLIKLTSLSPDVLVYPAHGAGTLCGKAMRDAAVSTIAMEINSNPALALRNKQDFIDYILAEQPFIPCYFNFDVELNIQGAPPISDTFRSVSVIHAGSFTHLDHRLLIIDTREAAAFNRRHFKNSYNIQDALKFETWLGSVVQPYESFVLVGENMQVLEKLYYRVGKIGYERKLKSIMVNDNIDMDNSEASPVLNVVDFTSDPQKYTIVDVRNKSERENSKAFNDTFHIPLPEIRTRYKELPVTKPVVVHCQGGYRSAIAASILRSLVELPVYDIGSSVSQWLQPVLT